MPSNDDSLLPSMALASGANVTRPALSRSLCAGDRSGGLLIRPLHLALAGLLVGSCAPHSQPSNDVVFVSNEGTNQVSVLDGATGRSEGTLATGPRPRGMAFSPDGKVLYVAASNANRIEAWDVHSRNRVATYASGSDPERFAVLVVEVAD